MKEKLEIFEYFKNLSSNISMVRRCLDVDGLSLSLKELESKCADDSLWQDVQMAHELLSKKAKVQGSLDSFLSLESEYTNNINLLELALNENDDSFFFEIQDNLLKLEERIKDKEIECLFTEIVDSNNCYIEIHSGAGGTESNDWANMLMRMYIRWAENYHNFKAEIVDKLDGDEVGIRSVTIKVIGEKAYGWAKSESGIHRLVRISPFDAGAKRHTSFASVGISPIIDETIDVRIDEKDLRIDTYRSSGAGGQHVNKTESAIRITHIPTGIVVRCQNDRSQHRNRDEAFKLLKGRLYQLELQKREQKIAREHGKKSTIGWGSQIRSYVMSPYQMVKDLRTGQETGNVNAVLDGNIDPFIMAFLTNKS
ncbi:peptide chain release factor 2 [Candidatus Mesenet endosymbiont of Agriotes lineatus]|uniref:peptide chain release factor 2 n=1 Tax=Candidatus Mesenet endosymbiont of Agriotes lineatus TaxID=3077948 RepID=UPI0030D2D743